MLEGSVLVDNLVPLLPIVRTGVLQKNKKNMSLTCYILAINSSLQIKFNETKLQNVKCFF
jgi:hypothetical protein